MRRITAADEFEQCVDQLYEGIASPKALNEALASCCRFAGAASASFFNLLPDGRIGYFYDFGHDPAVIHEFTSHYAALDPTRAPDCAGSVVESWRA